MPDDTTVDAIKRMADVWTNGKGWPQETMNKWATLFRDERPDIVRRAVDDLLLTFKGTYLKPHHLQEYLEKIRRKYHVGTTAYHCQRCGEPVSLQAGAGEQHEAVCIPMDPHDRKANAKLVEDKWRHRNPKSLGR